jgi:thymidylate synthase
MVNAWNVGELDQMVLPPCHYGFQIYTKELSDERRYNIWFNNNYETGMERFFDPNNLPDFDNSYYKQTPKRAISLMWNQRSVDTFLGLPFNIASYGLLLMMIADEVGMIPDELIGNLGDVHLYSNHIEQAKEQISRTPYELPKVHVRDGIESFMPGDIILEKYESHPTIKAPLSN